MNIIGINAYHADSSAALLIDGNLKCATEEERFTRIKHWAGLPIQSIKFCLEYAGLSIQDIDKIVIGRDPAVKKKEKIEYLIKNPKSGINLLKQRLNNKNDITKLESLLKNELGRTPDIGYIEHHRAHLASAFFSSPFQESAIISIDGSGDFTTVIFGYGTGNKIKVIDTQNFPISVGIFYTAFTQFLGFPYYGDEYKVMGLSPYGKDIFKKEIKELFFTGDTTLLRWNKKFFDINSGVISYENNIPQVSKLYNEVNFKTVFGPPRIAKTKISQRDKDLAKSVQSVTEDVIFNLLNKLYNLTPSSNICLAGGVAQNSVANGKILQNTSFKDLYVPSAGHDAGIAMGAAQYEYFHNHNKPRTKPVYNANLGIEFSNNQIEEIINKYGLKATFYEDKELNKYLAKSISNGKVVGYFQGRAEFGPRALGSRSILADPRNANAQQLLNEKIKKRESFRPFAPSILEEYGDEYFDNYQFTPFMERVLKIKTNKQKLIPAVTHVDGTGRLQSVRKKLRPKYYNLIEEFRNITGIPILINTSFNENEPVVNRPEEAIDCYLRTDLDILCLENYVLEK